MKAFCLGVRRLALLLPLLSAGCDIGGQWTPQVAVVPVPANGNNPPTFQVVIAQPFFDDDDDDDDDD